MIYLLECPSLHCKNQQHQCLLMMVPCLVLLTTLQSAVVTVCVPQRTSNLGVITLTQVPGSVPPGNSDSIHTPLMLNGILEGLPLATDLTGPTIQVLMITWTIMVGHSVINDSASDSPLSTRHGSVVCGNDPHLLPTIFRKLHHNQHQVFHFPLHPPPSTFTTSANDASRLQYVAYEWRCRDSSRHHSRPQLLVQRRIMVTGTQECPHRKGCNYSEKQLTATYSKIIKDEQ